MHRGNLVSTKSAAFLLIGAAVILGILSSLYGLPIEILALMFLVVFVLLTFKKPVFAVAVFFCSYH